MLGKKHYIPLFVMSLLLIAQVWIAGAQDVTPRFWLSSEIQHAVAGQEFEVAVNVGGATQIYGGSFQVLYDAQAFEVIVTDNKAVTPGAFFGSAPNFPLKNSADPATGTIDYALTLTQPAQPVSGDGVLGTVKFRALKDAPVSMMPVKASLVSPEFTEVDGRLIAQKINQVDAAIQEMTIGAAMSSQTVSELISAPAQSVQPEILPTSAPNTDTAVASVSVAGQNPVLAAPANNTPVIAERIPVNRIVIVAGLFFFAGLVLLIVSVGMYSKMRVRFSIAGDNLPEHVL
jgi:hypothetical protein